MQMEMHFLIIYCGAGRSSALFPQIDHKMRVWVKLIFSLSRINGNLLHLLSDIRFLVFVLVQFHPMKVNHKLLFCGACFASFLVMMTSCEEPTAKTSTEVATEGSAISTTGTMKFEGEIISIPSPIQVATIIQKNNLPFKQELLNGLQNKEKYINETKKALNMGVYGTDLAYIANYNLGQLNNDYFDALASIASDLGVLENVDKGLITKLDSNLSNRDSLLGLNGEFFRTADRYLRNNDRTHLSSYILIGGWIESLHLTADASQTNEELRKRLGEQKYSAGSIMNLVSKLNDPAFDSIKEGLNDLCELLSALESTYIYRQPINDQREKITYLRSQTSVKIDTEEMAAIGKQIETVRNAIIE